MTRLDLIDPESASGEAKHWLDAVQSALGVTPNMAKGMANSPVVLKGWVELIGTLGQGKLDAKLREKIALAVAEANRSDYCLSAHTVLGGGVGVDSAELELSRSAESADPKTAAALRFAQTIIDKRGGVSDADVGAVREAGFGDGEIAEIVANVALHVLTNYFNKVAETEIDFPVVSAGVAAAA